MKKTLFLIISILFNVYSYGAYLTNVPIILTQPDGTVINCFATGDEFYNWVHDSLGYTIIQDTTGYYCYAVLDNDSLVCSGYIVGNVLPQSVGLQPRINLSGEKIGEIRNAVFESMFENDSILQQAPVKQRGASNSGTRNNIVIYIRFADQPDFPAQQSIYTTMFNGTNYGDNSLRNYFREVSYYDLDIISHFYPKNNGTTILSYKSSHNRNYYCKYDKNNNPDGYKSRAIREHKLLYDAIKYVKDRNEIPSDLDVDNVCFIIRGGSEGWNEILWPHQWSLYSNVIYINGTRVWNYNFQLEEELIWNNRSIGTGVLCHEMNHSLGAPDLYHYDKYDSNTPKGVPVGIWDLMGTDWEPPQYISAYMKYKYGGWISSIPSITTSGNYTLNPLSSYGNNCYKIPIQGSSQYLLLEYRKQTGTFESSLPGSGLIIYRIDERYKGNRKGDGYGGLKKDEVYVFRPNDPSGPTSSNGYIRNAHFSGTSGRTVFSNSTNPYCFSKDGDCGNMYIKNIRENANGTLSFDVRYCNGSNITYSNTSNLPAFTSVSNNITTSGTVVVKSTDNVTFEAGNKVNLLCI